MKSSLQLLSMTACMAVAACAVQPPTVSPAQFAPSEWSTPSVPSEPRLAQLQEWWAQFDDPLMAELVRDAQRANPRLAEALARVREARALARAAGAAAGPSLDGGASASRQQATSGVDGPATTVGRVALDALWEIDLFGRVRNDALSAAERAEAAAMQWHDARVSLAAETAQSYAAYRSCEALAQVFDQEAESQSKLAELTQRKVEVGFESPANGALAIASAAEVSSRRIAQRAECEMTLRQLSVLTAQDTSALRARLANRTAQLPRPAAFDVASVPADVLSQRPDIAASERLLRAAAYAVGVAEADRYPRLTLNGSIGISYLRTSGSTLDTPFWSIGPALSLPLFDSGRRRATADAAQARLDEVRAAHEGRLRAAVGEVEEAILRLDSTARREGDTDRAARGYADYFTAARERWRLGAGSQIELEDARRLWLNAQASLINVQRDRVSSWIALYKAVGGGWTPSAPIATDTQTDAQTDALTP